MTHKTIYIVKVGGRTLGEEHRRRPFLDQFIAVPGPKILVHGGGVAADMVCKRMGLEPQKVAGRRITDKDALDVIVMVYAGLVNKTVVSELAARGVNALGVTGADMDLITAIKRPVTDIDYGYVGDVAKVNGAVLDNWLEEDTIPVVAPVTHDGQGTLLNTNADTIAAALATTLVPGWSVRLIYAIDRPGVLRDGHDHTSVLSSLDTRSYSDLRTRGVITDGMLPKLDNGFAAMAAGVETVLICPEDGLGDAAAGLQRGTLLCR